MPPKTNGIAEILASRQFPDTQVRSRPWMPKNGHSTLQTHPGIWSRGCSRKEWVVENLSTKHVRVRDEAHHRRLQRRNNCVHDPLGERGLKDVYEKAQESRKNRAKRKAGAIAPKPEPSPEKKKVLSEQDRIAKKWDRAGIDNEIAKKHGI